MSRARAYLLLALLVLGVVSCGVAFAGAFATQFQYELQDPNNPAHWETGDHVIQASKETGICAPAMSVFGAGSTCGAEGAGAFGGMYTYNGYNFRWRTAGCTGADCAVIQAGPVEPDPDPDPDPNTELTAADVVELCWMVIGVWAAAWTVKVLAMAARPN